MKDGPTTIEESLKALRNLGVTPNDYDSAALDMVLEWIEDRIANVAPEESSTQHRLLCTKDRTLPGVVFRELVQHDADLARVWHDNLTEMALSAGAPPNAAAERASDFMRHAFGVEIPAKPSPAPKPALKPRQDNWQQVKVRTFYANGTKYTDYR